MLPIHGDLHADQVCEYFGPLGTQVLLVFLLMCKVRGGLGHYCFSVTINDT